VVRLRRHCRLSGVRWRDVRSASAAGGGVLHRELRHLHFQRAPRQLACAGYTVLRWSVSAVRLSRRPADTPLSFDPSDRVFDSPERLPCRLLEVTASKLLGLDLRKGKHGFWIRRDAPVGDGYKEMG